jgi:hypothetical protein
MFFNYNYHSFISAAEFKLSKIVKYK